MALRRKFTGAKHSTETVDGVSLHYYTCAGWTGSKGSATKFSEDDYYWTIGKCLEIEDIVRKHADIMDRKALEENRQDTPYKRAKDRIKPVVKLAPVENEVKVTSVSRKDSHSCGKMIPRKIKLLTI